MNDDCIYAFIKKPVGRGHNRYWRAFSFSNNAFQDDVEAFMIDIHIKGDSYFLLTRKDLEKVKPYKGGSNQRTIYYHNSTKYGRIFVLDTPVGFTWEYRKEDGRRVKHRAFIVR